MEEKHVYEYAVMRYVPRVEREEFINVGLLMMCKRLKWIKAEIYLDPEKLAVFDCAHTLDEIRNQFDGFLKVRLSLHLSTTPRPDIRSGRHIQPPLRRTGQLTAKRY